MQVKVYHPPHHPQISGDEVEKAAITTGGTSVNQANSLEIILHLSFKTSLMDL